MASRWPRSSSLAKARHAATAATRAGASTASRKAVTVWSPSASASASTAPSTRSIPAWARRRNDACWAFTVFGAAVHPGQELVAHLDQLVEKALARFDQGAD